MIAKKTQFLLVALIVSLTNIAVCQADIPERAAAREYFLKAAFLRYVVKYIEWPDDTRSSSNVCVYGAVPSDDGLQSITGRVVNGRPIIVKTVDTLDAAEKECQLLFISKAEEANVPVILKTLYNKPILTFGDMKGFAEAGGTMNFYIVNNRMGIQINMLSLEDSNLKISPKMLRLVTVVPDIDPDSYQEE